MFNIDALVATADDDKKVTEYDSTGSILTVAILQPEIVAMLEKDHGKLYISGWHDAATKYIVAGVATNRPVNPTVLTGQNLTALPVPCNINIDGKDYPCNEDHCELGLTVAKTYKVTVTAFPIQDSIFEITVP